MKVLIAGATGALGMRLVPRLVEAGHEVAGTTRTPSKQGLLSNLGAKPVVVDALDAEAVGRVVAEVEPDVIVHQLTALAGRLGGRGPDLGPTNRLRIEATGHLLAAGRAIGVQRFVAQSFAGSGLPFARVGRPVKSEDDPLDTDRVPGLKDAIDAIRHLESAVTGADWTEGIVLRYGSFYGPGTSFVAGGESFEMIRRRKMPLVGNGAGVWSFIHVDDAAEATVVAIERGGRGIYHIVDDDPAPVSEWLPAAAAALGAKPPLGVPRWLARWLAGEAATLMMTEGRGASNAKAKRELDWRPAHPSWRQGFTQAAG